MPQQKKEVAGGARPPTWDWGQPRTEAGEVQKYRSAMAEALARGLKDAAAGAGTYAFTNYVDLGAGVLVLWYGGRIVMTKDGLSSGAAPNGT